MAGSPRPELARRPAEDTPPAAGQSRLQTVRTAALAVIATLLAVLAVNAFSADEPEDAAATTDPVAVQPEQAPGPSGGEVTSFVGVAAGSLGAEDAPVVMEVWSDFACPYCAKFAVETQPSLVAMYVDAGDLRLEFHDFPAQGQPSLDAAVAARAAARQGVYVEYADLLYANPRQLDRGTLIGHAEALGLDTTRFEQDLDDPALETAVRSDWLAGQQAGVRATPSFVIDRSLVAGAQPLEQFQAFVDHFLAASD